MRVASIDGDGIFRDADGRRYGKNKKRRPMLGNGHKGLSHLAGPSSRLGQISPSAPDNPGPAYLIAIQDAKPASSFRVTRTQEGEGDLFPGRILVSADPSFSVPCKDPQGRAMACGTVFRFSARPSEEGEVLLLSLEGKAVGSYSSFRESEILNGTLADGSPKFYVVSLQKQRTVELNIVMPRPFVDGDFVDWQADGLFAGSLIQQASFGLVTLPRSFGPLDFDKRWDDLRVQCFMAGGLGYNAIDRAAMAYDFSAIGKKALNIYVRVGSEIVSQSTDLVLHLLGSKGTTDEAKIAEFYKKVDQVTEMSDYWAMLMVRAELFSMNTLAGIMFSTSFMRESSEGLNASILETLQLDPDGIASRMVGKTAGSEVITPERASAIVSDSIRFLQSVRTQDAEGAIQFEATLRKALGPDVRESDLPSIINFLSTMLQVNAEEILKKKEELARDGIQVSAPLDGLGQTQSFNSIYLALSTVPPPPGAVQKAAIQTELISSIKAKAYEALRTGNVRQGMNNLSKFFSALAKPYKAIASRTKSAPDYEEFVKGRELIKELKRSAKTDAEVSKLNAELDKRQLNPLTAFKRAADETVLAFDDASKRVAWRSDLTAEKAFEVAEKEISIVADRLSQGLSYKDLETGQMETVAFGLPGGPFKKGVNINIIDSLHQSYATGGYLTPELQALLLKRDLSAHLVEPLAFAAEMEKRAADRADKIAKAPSIKRPVTTTDPKSPDKDVVKFERLAKAARAGTAMEKVAVAHDNVTEIKSLIAQEASKPEANKTPVTPDLYGKVLDTFSRLDDLIRPPRTGEGGKILTQGGLYADLMRVAKDVPENAAIFKAEKAAADLLAAEKALSELRAAKAEADASLGNIKDFETFKKNNPSTEKTLQVLEKLEVKIAETEKAMAVIRATLQKSSWRRGYNLTLKYLDQAWEFVKGGGSRVMGALEKNVVSRAVFATVALPAILVAALQPIWMIAQLVLTGRVDIKASPFGFVEGMYGVARGLLSNEYMDPGVSDPGGSPGVTRPAAEGMSPITKLVLLGLGVTLIASGGKVFSAVEKVVLAFSKIVETSFKFLVPPKKTKGKKGGGPSGRGRGRPPSVTKAEEELERARERGDDEAVEKAEKKLEKAQRAAFMRGLIWG